MHSCQNFSEWELCRPATIIIMVITVTNIMVIISAMIILVMVIMIKILAHQILLFARLLLHP